MPTLNWIGKEKVVNHHRHVPMHVLRHVYGFTAEDGKTDSETGSGNMIIHGDNLAALKSLLPEYEGRVDCIYIDPPYNTGNENWVYNDNVNDPHIRRWLGDVVGKEGEDLSRHDKWCCMMYPRLRLLHQLMSEHGVIFISIDDNELYNLKSICDEIFGENCFVANISWQRTYSMRNDSKGIPSEIEHVLSYSKHPLWEPLRLPRTEEMNKNYKNPDHDIKGSWQNTSAFAPAASTHQGMVYAIQHPFTGELLYPTANACWRYAQDAMLDYMNGWTEYNLQFIDDDEKRAEICGVSVENVKKGIPAILLAKPLEESRKEAEAVYKRGNWPRFFFTNGGKGGIRRKTYLEGLEGKKATNFWSFSEVGHTDEAKKEILSIFGGKSVFDTPKPTRFVKRILDIATNKVSVVLDSFAGSGTTAHSILQKNKEDGGNRKFILVEMGDYADTVTAERTKRVIQGYGKVEGLGGSFDYYELGPALYTADHNLNEEVGEDALRSFIYYTETRQPLRRQREDSNRYLLDTRQQTGYYFYYEPKDETILTVSNIGQIVRERAGQYIIYADACTISEEQRRRMHVIFKKIPRDIKKF